MAAVVGCCYYHCCHCFEDDVVVDYLIVASDVVNYDYFAVVAAVVGNVNVEE